MRLTGRATDLLRRPEMRRRILAMADQGASSLSNVVAVMLVARSFDSSVPLGAFSLAMVAYELVQGSLRGVIGEPLLSLYSHEPPSVRRRLVSDLHGTTLFLGGLCSLGLGVVSIVVGGISGAAILALAAVLPLLLVQDALRFHFIIDRPGAALAIDGVWLAAVVVAMPLAPDGASVAWFVLVWGLAGGAGALLGLVLDLHLPGWPHPWRWLSQHRSTIWRFFSEFIAARSAAHLVLVGVGAIAGLGALGAAKASLVYFGVLNTLHMGLYLVVVPEGARSRDDPAKLRRLMTRVVAGLMGLAVVWTIGGVLVPDAWGRELLGATWPEAEKLMVPMGLAMVAGGVASGAFLGLRSLGDARRSLTARLYGTPWQVVCPLVGAAVGGVTGFAVGFAAGRAVYALIWWRSFERGLDDVTLAAGPGANGDAAPVATTTTARGDVDHQEVAI